jgi:DNA-binding response OmpR family regulator
MAKILIVEDDQRLNELVYMNLKLVGHSCDRLYDGLSVMTQIAKHPYDLLLLDVMLPGMSGFEVMEALCSTNVPVIFITAKTELKERIKGFHLGADDYITKPFEMLELQARINAVLRRTGKNEKYFIIGPVKIDFAARCVYKNDSVVECAPKEFDLLEVFVINRNIALSRDKLLELVWGYDYIGETRTVDVHIQRLRKKLDLDNYIKTVYKIGYRLEISNES